VVDPATPPEYLLDLPAMGRDRVGDSWFVLGHHAPTGGIAVHSMCCSTYAGDTLETQEVLTVDSETGVPSPLVQDAEFGAALDRTGRFFLLARHDHDGRGTGLYLLEKDGDLRLIGEGYDQVAW
jgi:hypothetical protein